VVKSICPCCPCCPFVALDKLLFSVDLSVDKLKHSVYLCVYFQMISDEMQSLETYRYFVSDIWIVVKVLQNVKHESCS